MTSAEKDYSNARRRVAECEADVNRRSRDLQDKRGNLADVKDPRANRSHTTIRKAEKSVEKGNELLYDAQDRLRDAKRDEEGARRRLSSEHAISDRFPREIAATINDNNYGRQSGHRYH